MSKLVIIPTYNELENVEAIIAAVMERPLGYHVLIIDDGSPDGTADLVKSLIPKYSDRLFIEERLGKLGLGTAYIHGFKWALKNGYDFIFEMDADFSHNPMDLDKLHAACEAGADMSVGSRYVQGGAISNWPANRIFLSKGASLYTRLLTGMPIKDPTAGFVCYTKKVLESINFDSISFVGYAFQIEMKFAVWKLGFLIKEVPITFIDRRLGVSKMNKGIIKEGVLGVINLKIQSLGKKYENTKTAASNNEN